MSENEKLEAARKAVTDICERSSDSLDAWSASRGHVTSRAAWRARALEADAALTAAEARIKMLEAMVQTLPDAIKARFGTSNGTYFTAREAGAHAASVIREHARALTHGASDAG